MTAQRNYHNKIHRYLSTQSIRSLRISVFPTSSFCLFCTALHLEISFSLCYLIITEGDTDQGTPERLLSNAQAANHRSSIFRANSFGRKKRSGIRQFASGRRSKLKTTRVCDGFRPRSSIRKQTRSMLKPSQYQVRKRKNERCQRKGV